jgi:dimethylamine monooxygenase subunit A
MRYFPLTDDDSRPQLHIKPLDLKEWIEFDEHFDFQTQKKSQLLKTHRETVLRVLDGADEAAIELNELLRDHLVSIGRPSPTNATPQNGEEALIQISSWVQEDWALMSANTPVILNAGLICFPSRWSLADKIGLDSNAIHAPVPRFETVAKPTQNFLERMTTDKPMWRINWTIHDSNELFCPGPHPSATDLTRQNILSRTWLRIERQTLRRLPQTKAIAFSIRTYLHPMTEVAADPQRKQQLNTTLANLNSETAAYKGMRAFHGLLLAAIKE